MSVDHPAVFRGTHRLKLAVRQHVLASSANLLLVVMPGQFPLIRFEPAERLPFGGQIEDVQWFRGQHFASPFSQNKPELPPFISPPERRRRTPRRCPKVRSAPGE